MQRKNSILIALGVSGGNIFRRNMFTGAHSRTKGTSKRTNRSGFAMIMAVGVIIMISTIMILSLNTTASTSKRTVDLFLYEQAELHTKSAIEYALYTIATNGCTDKISLSGTNALDDVYDINIDMKYSYTNETGGTTASGCDNLTPVNAITTPEQNGSVMMDVTVTIPSSITGTEPVTFFRRTIQKL